MDIRKLPKRKLSQPHPLASKRSVCDEGSSIDVVSKNVNSAFDETANINQTSVPQSVCLRICCRPDATDAFQPIIGIEATRVQVGQKNEYRTFQVGWYKRFQWLTLCQSRNVAFCFCCLWAS